MIKFEVEGQKVTLIFVDDELYFVRKGENISKYSAKVLNAESLSKLQNDEIENIFILLFLSQVIKR